MVFTGGWPGRQGGAAKVNTSVHSGLAVSVGTAGDTLGEGHFPRGPATWGQCWGGVCLTRTPSLVHTPCCPSTWG